MFKNNILVIGGAGYIGTEVTNLLINNNYNLTNIDNLVYDNRYAIESFIKNKNYKFINSNINSEEINRNFLNNYEAVIILSGLVGDPITKLYPELSKDYNINFIKNFIIKCKNSKIKKLIFVSTCSNYGIIKENTTADEKHKLNPVSEYAKAKIEIEKYLEKIKSEVNFQTTILRFATAFGVSRRMRFDLTISHFVKDAFINKKITIFDEKTWRPYCHVKDFARLIQLVLQNDSNYKFEIFNAGGNSNNYSKEIIAFEIKKRVSNLSIEYLKGDIDPRNYKVNFDKVIKFYDFTPNFDLIYGIDELLFLLEKNTYSFNNQNLNLYGNYNLDKLL